MTVKEFIKAFNVDENTYYAIEDISNGNILYDYGDSSGDDKYLDYTIRKVTVGKYYLEFLV